MTITHLCNTIIKLSFYSLFLLVPLVLSSQTSELFELNKMWVVYGFTIVIVGAWISKMIATRNLFLQRTPLDIPLMLFLASQIISSIYSLDPYVSFWGYYTRFNGGLLSLICYIILYYAFVSNVSFSHTEQKVKEKSDLIQAKKSKAAMLLESKNEAVLFTKKSLLVSIIAGAVVALWGLPSHFGYDPTCFIFRGNFDVSCWTQDFQPKIRIFSTLGQPDWLAAYLALLIPVSIAWFLSLKTTLAKISQKALIAWLFLGTAILFYSDLLFTRARSGFAGLLLALLFFFAVLALFYTRRTMLKASIAATGLASYGFFLLSLWKHAQAVLLAFWLLFAGFCITLISVAFQAVSAKKLLTKPMSYIALGFIFITLFIGTPFDQLNIVGFPTIQRLLTPIQKAPAAAQKQAAATDDVGGTESSKIRLVVWKGAIEAWKHNPIFGTGVETFAYAYYQFRPREQNLTSEWDFLYNKAHNEYLNYLTTTGIVGLATYLLLITYFLFITLREVAKQITQKQPLTQEMLLVIGLVAGYLSILLSNFFGFSVVIINLYFFLIPAFVLTLCDLVNSSKTISMQFGSKNMPSNNSTPVTVLQWIGIGGTALIATYLLIVLYTFWLADVDYNNGYNFNRGGDYQQGYFKLHDAVAKRSEPTFQQELAYNDAVLAVALYSQKHATDGAQLRDEAIAISNDLTKQHPNNVLYWKNRVKIFYALSQLDPQYLLIALPAIQKAHELAPNDPSVSYSLGILYGQTGNIEKAIETLKQTTVLKPDYSEAYYALGLYYHNQAIDKRGNVTDPILQAKAVDAMHYILEHIASDDAKVLQVLKTWGKQ